MNWEPRPAVDPRDRLHSLAMGLLWTFCVIQATFIVIVVVGSTDLFGPGAGFLWYLRLGVVSGYFYDMWQAADIAFAIGATAGYFIYREALKR